jgi:ketosteroid isomerase-like protein
MSEENVALVGRVLRAIELRDVDRIVAEVDPDFELHPLVSVWERSYRGREGVERWQQEVESLWETFRLEPEEFRDLDDDRLVMVGRWSGRAKGGTEELSGPIAAAVRFSGGKAVRADFYLDEESAMQAVEEEP